MSATVPARPAAALPVHWPAIDVRKGDPIDRLAAAFQRARLWKRRARRQLSEARQDGDGRAIHTARLRYRRACHWRTVLYRHYVRAVFAAYC